MISKTSISSTIIVASVLLLGACSSDDDGPAVLTNDGATTTDPADGNTEPDTDTTSGGGSSESPVTPPTGPITNPGVAPETDPGDNPVTDPADDPLTDPGDSPITDPGDDPITEPGDGQVTDPGDDPVTDPGEDPVTGPPPVPPLTGPGDGPDTGNPDGQGSSDTSAIAGLWDVSDELFFVDESLGIDIMYLEITSTGLKTTFDFQQDDVDLGENCYEITASPIISLSDNKYLVDPDSAFEQEITAIVNDDTLDVSYVDIFDDNDNEDTTEVLSFSYPRLVGLDPVFNECTE